MVMLELVVLFHFDYRFAVGAIVAFRVGLRDCGTVQAVMDFVNGRLDPGVTPSVGNDGYLKLEPPVESLSILIAIAVDDVAGV
jgi:hypothetical protein